MAQRAERKLAAILALDVVGYSRLVEADELAALNALEVRRAAVHGPDLRFVQLRGRPSCQNCGARQADVHQVYEDRIPGRSRLTPVGLAVR